MKLNRTELAKELKNELNMNQQEAADAIKIIFDGITKQLQENNSVDIYHFGRFEVRERGERQGINPMTKEKITIPATQYVKFTSSSALKDKVN